MDDAATQTENYPPRGEPSPAVGLYLALKRGLYHLCKWIGLFRLARRLTRGRLRIICYHGFSMADESLFLPRTFIGPDTFRRRMELLSESGFEVLGLEGALQGLRRGDLPPLAAVITIDDGFYSMYRVAYPVLRERSFPATVYVTTYYAVKGTPVFGLAVDYLFWKTAMTVFDATGLGLPFSDPVPIGTAAERSRTAREIILFGESRLDEPGRIALSKAIAGRLGVDYDAVVRSRILSIMSAEEIGELSRAGIDIQLHTHRHDLGAGREDLLREIADCRSVLEPIVGRPLVHFCYPGGRWRREQWAWLGEAGIASGATCDRGLNDASTPVLGLKRFGDDEAMARIEFEAELSGFAELLRSLVARTAGRRTKGAPGCCE